MFAFGFRRGSMMLSLLLTAMCLTASGASVAGPSADGPVVSKNVQDDGLVRDSAGRLAYTVMLYPESASSYPNSLTRGSHFPSYHKVQAVNEVRDIESYYGIHAIRMTSWVALSFTAFLTNEQAQVLARDPRVEKVYPDSIAKPSFNSLTDAGAVWNDYTSGGSVSSWGKMAVNPSTTQSAGTAYVYVLDGGVGQHQDLNVVEWVEPTHTYDCGTRAGANLDPCTVAKLKYMVGCYPHATAVAGIIGGKGIIGGRMTGSYGINPGVKIISVEVSDGGLVDNDHNCLIQGFKQHETTASGISSALDWIYSDTVSKNNPLTSVVNISSNWDPKSDSSNDIDLARTAMYTLANPPRGRGALIVQSAGNNYEDACKYAYNPNGGNVALTTDGIIVVSAVNTHDQPVIPLVSLGSTCNGTGNCGFWKDSAQFRRDHGSNYGPCVDMWAPGDGIYTTVPNPTTTLQQDSSIIYATYGFGSGTSFSAPEIAGLASLLIEQQTIIRPNGGQGAFTTGAEAAVRSLLKNLGSHDTCNGTCNTPVMMPTTNLQVRPATPYGELLITYHYTSPPQKFVNTLLLNGFAMGPTDYYTQSQSAIRAYGQTTAPQLGLYWNFASTGTLPYGCTVTRNLQPTGTATPMVSNQTQAAGPDDEELWNPSANGSMTWTVNSTCLPSGIRVTQ
jgi:hypothetical protein